MRKRYGSWTASMLAVLVVLCGISSVRAQLFNPKFYPTLSLRNFHCYPDGIQRVPYPSAGGDRYFLVPVYIYNEVDTTFNPNTTGQHLEPVRSFEFQFTYLTQAMTLDVTPSHGSPVVMIGPGPTDTALAKTFFVNYSDQPDLSTGNPFLHRIRLAGAGSVPLAQAMTSDSGCSEGTGVLLWLRFKVVVSNTNGGKITLDSARFNDHIGDPQLNSLGSNSLDFTHGNFGGGIGQSGRDNKGEGEISLTAQPAFLLQPFSQITAIDAANYQMTADLVYDPTTGASTVTRNIQMSDANGGTSLDNIHICSNVSWLVLSLQGPTGGTQCVPSGPPALNLDYTSSFGAIQKTLWLNIPSPATLAPGIYFAVITFTSDGASNSPTRLLVRFERLANPNEPAPGGKGTGIRLNISNSCSPVCTSTLAFGTGAGATEGLDLLYGEHVLGIADTIAFDTAVIASERCYAYFRPLNLNVDPAFLDPNFVGTTRDIRSDKTDTTLIYQVYFNPGGPNCRPEHVCIDPADFPDGARIVMKFVLNGSDQGIDFRTASLDQNGMRCITINDVHIDHFYIEYTPAIQANISAFLKKYSWTLISLPVVVPNPDARIIFPNAVGVPWAYSTNSGWNPPAANQLEFGRGYMIRYGDFIGTDGTVAGIKSYTVNNVKIDQGWNTVGGVSGPTSINNGSYGILLTPNVGSSIVPQLLNSVWEFTPQNGYDVTNFIIPGRGYFIKVDASGYYNLNAPVPPNGTKQVQGDPAGKAAEGVTLEGQLARVQITDAAQNGQRLYCGSAVASHPETYFEMPAPFRDFDARFAGTNGNISFNHSSYVVNLKSASYPVTMTFSNLQGTAEVKDSRGTVIGTATNGGTVTITDATQGSLEIALKSSDGVPTNAAGFSLDQNMPNPFGEANAVTTIRYSVPQELPVSLVVYNTLGQVVGTLVNEVVSAGQHEAVFNGSELAPGTYYYTLKAGNFVQTQHMTLTK